jgi:hypothetical protein
MLYSPSLKDGSMGLLETLALQVGPAVGKALLKCWLKDSKFAAEVSSSLVDLLKSKTTDIIAQQRGKRQFEDIGERIALSLKPIFDSEGNNLEEGSRNAVALAIAETFNKSHIISIVLVERDLDPDKLAKHLMNSYTKVTRHFSEAEIALYQRITSEISQNIVDIASQLPAFTEHSFAEILKRERQLLTTANQILEEVRRIHRASEQKNDKRHEVAHFEAEYCRAVIRNLDKLELFGVDVSTASRRYRLSVAYVSLSVEPKTLRAYSEKKFAERVLNTPNAEDSEDRNGKIIIPVDKLLAKTHNVLIQGLAGSGKTTLLQWIAVCAALRTFTGKLIRLNTSVPFFIPLRQCVESGYPAPENFLRFIAPAIASTMPTNWVHEQLGSGRAVVLIDGVDEVPEPQRGDVRAWLEGARSQGSTPWQTQVMALGVSRSSRIFL